MLYYIAASEWVFRIGEHQNYLGTWRQYASDIEQGLEFEELSTIDVDEGIEWSAGHRPAWHEFSYTSDSSQEELSDFYNRYNEVWADDVNTYFEEFVDE